MEIANGPADGSGVKIMPGELGKALELIAAGTAIDYDGASGRDADRTGGIGGPLPAVRSQGRQIRDRPVPVIRRRGA